MNRAQIISGLVLIILMGLSACASLSEPTAIIVQTSASGELITFTSTSAAASTSAPVSTLTMVIPITGPLMIPPDTVPEVEKPVNDVESSATSAPNGDSYRINRFERPFEQDMTYVPDLDIIRFGLSEDDTWYYLSLTLNGDDPNNSLGINYGVEIDLNADGFGDYLVWARPPYTTEWEADIIQVFKDGDRDTAGFSSRQSNAVFLGNGYETLFFDGGSDQNPNQDLAWVRMQESEQATIQFALKKSWLGDFFLFGVVSDGGLKDPSMFDYNDKFKEEDAGSPIQDNLNYPLGSLFAVDNTCWQAHGSANFANQPKFCPPEALPTPTPRLSSNLQPTNTVHAPSSTVPPSTATERPSATNTNPPPATNTDLPQATNTNPPPATDTDLPPATNTNPPPIDTKPPPPLPTAPPTDTAGTPEPVFDSGD